MSSCCGDQPEPEEVSCCGKPGKKKRPDFLLWISLILCLAAIIVHLSGFDFGSSHVAQLSHSVSMLLAEMWWGLALGIIAVGVLAGVPREFIISALGRKTGPGSLLRATGAGLLLDLCNHGILLVGMSLYQRGATLGQTMAFLIASPWNSLSLTLILAALIGWPWTLAFLLASGLIALITGLIFHFLVRRGILPENPNRIDLPADFRFFEQAKKRLKATPWNVARIGEIFRQGILGSRMILRWLLFGTLLAAVIQVFVPSDIFSEYFGPTVIGLFFTLLAATIIEVCSEGSTPIAADLFNRAAAPGNAFTFLMAGAATDYTEIMALKETTKSWKISFFLPLLSVPQVLFISWIMNAWG